MTDLLPRLFLDWFAARGWSPRAHQLALAQKVRDGESVLLVAPTGAGKTLAGFLPSLVALSQRTRPRKIAGTKEPAPSPLHTLYISPLKALTVDIARNLEAPVTEMALPVTIETRTGDTSAAKRQRQRTSPPDILLTTPEQLALLLAHRDARPMFANLKRIIVDELHSLVTSKRGDLLALDLARVRFFAPNAISIGLSATVRAPEQLQRWLSDQTQNKMAALVTLKGGAAAHLSILKTATRLPIAGHTAVHAYGEIYSAIKAHKTTLLFVNTRMQAEFLFQKLWDLNEDALPIALHHGSLDVSQRRKVEAAMTAGTLRAVVCTSTLDLGIDWGDVDLVINLGAPKGASRLMQRVGRANHRLDEPSKALLVPTNRFEAMECRAALDAVAMAAQDTPDVKTGGLDVLAQHVLGMACSEAFDADALFAEVTSALPYADLDRQTFDDILNFAATGGYALKSYDRFAKIKKGKDGLWRISDAAMAQRYRMNVGTIVEEPMLTVRLGRVRTRAAGAAGGKIAMGGRVLGEVEEYFAEQLTGGDTFIFAGEILRFEGMQDNEVIVTRAPPGTDAKVPSYAGGRFPLSTFLAEQVRAMIADPALWKKLPKEV
ncbi:MAG: DEAD/DEAH box helicase, partial [Beijerinckiaceae bacterium]